MSCAKGYLANYKYECDLLTHICHNTLYCKKLTINDYIIYSTISFVYLICFLVFTLILCMMMDYGANVHGGEHNGYYMKSYLVISIIAIIVAVMNIYMM
jgi:heme/copper-type cytochrome/quinol oxidase subunit 2